MPPKSNYMCHIL